MMTNADAESAWVTICVTSVRVCSVSANTRDKICPVLVVVKYPIGRRCRWRYTASRRSRVTYSWSSAPNVPAIQMKRFLSATVARMTRMTLRSDCMGCAGSSSRPMVACRKVLTHPLPNGMGGCLNSSSRNGMRSANEYPSSAAPMKLATMFPAMRQACGRRNPNSRRYRPTCLTPRREQRHRQDHFFGGHAAVEERAAVARLILAQFGRIHEERVAHGQKRVPAQAAPRQSQVVEVREQQRVLGPLGAQVFAELV